MGITTGWLVLIIAAVVVIKIVVVLLVIRAHRMKVAAGTETLIGVEAKAKTDLNPQGIVFYMGEEWSAEVVGEPIKAGERVKVVSVEGVRLKVERVKEGE